MTVTGLVVSVLVGVIVGTVVTAIYRKCTDKGSSIR